MRRAGLVLAPVVFLALVAAVVAQLLPPRYRASVLVRAEWEVTDEALMRQPGIDVASRRTQAVRQRVMERALLQRVLREAEPYATGRATLSLDEATERLISDLRVRSMASSSFVIEFVHRNAATAARVPNLLAHFLAEGEGDERGRLAARLEEARRTLQQKAEVLDLPAPASSPPGQPPDETDSTPPDEEVFAEKRAVEASLAAARSRADRLRQAIAAEARSTTPLTTQQQLERMRVLLAQLRTRYTEEHPDVEELRRQILRLETSLPAAPAPSLREELRSTEASIEELMAREAQLEARTAQPSHPTSEPRRPAPSPLADPAPDRAVAEHQRAEHAYKALLAEWQAAQAPARPSRGPITRFELLREAAVPAAQESPKPVLFVLAGALAGLLTGVVAAVVAEHRDRRVKGPEDLAGILPVPLLATLPEVRTKDRR